MVFKVHNFSRYLYVFESDRSKEQLMYYHFGGRSSEHKCKVKRRIVNNIVKDLKSLI